MLNTTKHKSGLNLYGVHFTFLELCPFTKRKIAEFSFPFSNYSLSQPNVMNFILNAYFHKRQI